MVDEKNHRTTVSLPEGLFWKFQQEVARRRIATTNEAYADAIEQWLLTEGVPRPPLGTGSASHCAKLIVASIQSFQNPYQDLVASWRLSRTKRQVEGISAFRLDLE